MKFSEVVNSLMEGKPISRTGWENNNYIFYDKNDNCFVFVNHPESTLMELTLATKSILRRV